jgi:phosphatidylglycerophosphate synthase
MTGDRQEPDLRNALPLMRGEINNAAWRPLGFARALALAIAMGLRYSKNLPALRRSYFNSLLLVAAAMSVQLAALAWLTSDSRVLLPLAVSVVWFVGGSVIFLSQLSLVRTKEGQLAPRFGFSNTLTLFRFMTIPFLATLLPLFPGDRNVLLLGTAAFIVAAATDVLDGNYARFTGTVTDFGRIYDPVCDIIINGAVCIGAWGADYLPGWYAALALARFCLPVWGGAMVYASGREWRVRPTLLGKLSVFVYVLFIGLTLLGELSQEPFLRDLTKRFLMLSGLLFAFNVVYIIDRGFALMREERVSD